MSGGGHLLEDAGLVGGMGADREEDRLGAVCGKRGEHGGRVLGPWTIVEREHDLALAQEVVALEVLKAEAGAAGGVDFDDPRNAESIWIAARGRHGGGQGCRRGLGDDDRRLGRVGAARGRVVHRPHDRLWGSPFGGGCRGRRRDQSGQIGALL